MTSKILLKDCKSKVVAFYLNEGLLYTRTYVYGTDEDGRKIVVKRVTVFTDGEVQIDE